MPDLRLDSYAPPQRRSEKDVREECCKQEDLERVKVAGSGRVDITVGSALDIFGGKLPFAEVLAWHRHQEHESGH